MSDVGKRIARQRRAAGLTQADLAERVGVQPETISRIENGHNDPSLDLLSRMSGHLGVRTEELLRGQGSGSSKDEALEKLVLWASRLDASEIELVMKVAGVMLTEFRARPPRSPA
jgi:transcriptional regulator with XRE-family HTH domain